MQVIIDINDFVAITIALSSMLLPMLRELLVGIKLYRWTDETGQPENSLMANHAQDHLATSNQTHASNLC